MWVWLWDLPYLKCTYVGARLARQRAPARVGVVIPTPVPRLRMTDPGCLWVPTYQQDVFLTLLITSTPELAEALHVLGIPCRKLYCKHQVTHGPEFRACVSVSAVANTAM